MDKSSLLIDFNSPAQKKDLVIPLIPAPSLIPIIGIVEPSDDPFEVPVTDVADPFDAVSLQQVAKRVNSEQIAVEECQGTGIVMGDCKVDKSLVHIESEEIESIKADNVEKIVEKIEPAVLPPQNRPLNSSVPESRPSEVSSTNEILRDCKISHSISHAGNDVQDAIKDSSKLSNAVDSGNQSQMSADFSTEEGLKAVIAKRVNRCIQEVLNGSVKTSKNCDNSMLKKPQNKRSLSFVGLPSASSKNECDRLNKSCSGVNNTFSLENEQLDYSSDSSGFGILSPNSTDISGDGKEEEEDQVFKEARKLSRTFSKLADSFRLEKELESDDEDLLSCKPRWLYTDSSEDEEEKLRKDPALNFRRRSDSSVCSLPNATSAPATNNKASDSPALLAYKSRRSFTSLHAPHNNTQEELTLKRSISVGSKLKEVPVLPPVVTAVPVNLLKSADQPLKLRKKTFGDVKRGPLRAVLPVQSMTKEPVTVGGKKTSKQDTSPEGRIQKSAYIIGTPNKDTSQLNIPPMASSTPNRAEGFEPSKTCAEALLKPMTSAPVNKRHSLEGSFNNKGHDTSAEGARPRSNSVNSSIPRVMPVKPLRGLPLAVRSTSSLMRPQAQIKANNALNTSDKKTTPNAKTNPNKARVLTDVKSRSPRQSKVKTAVSTISSLVRGKKSASRDKENRVPGK